MTLSFPFDNTYARLPERFFSRVAPEQVRDPRVVKLNRPLAALLGLDADRLDSPEGAQVLAGNAIPEGAAPIALAYAGHQFGHFAGQLGDGRAILLGEIVGADGLRRDVQLKGSGRTPYSRGGDGRAALGPVLREYLVSEAMHALGVPTTRTLAAVTTGERVRRESMLPGAVLTRVAASHLRVGTFELLAARRDHDGLRVLAGYALARHYPAAAAAAAGDEPLALVSGVTAAQAELVARWLGLGFIHGVMNTDNTAISGETIDYGPCAFLDEYDPRKTFSSIDEGGRYAFANQPRIALWNLARLAEALLPVIDADDERAVARASERLDEFGPRFEAAHLRVQRAKLGLAAADPDDPALMADLYARLADNAVDFTRFFRGLCDAAADPARDAEVAAGFADPAAFHPWAERWRARLAREPGAPEARRAAMQRANPAFIPRNHRVEEVLAAAVRGDYAPFEAFTRVLERPWDDQPEAARWAEPPRPEERVQATFCGT